MNEKPSRLGLFLTELKRRHVWRAVIAYGAVTFVLLQAGEIILPAFGAPEWGLRLLVVVTLLGFPVALALAWIYEITPQGIRRTDDVTGGPYGQGRPGSLLPRLAFLGLTLVTAGAIGWWLMSSTMSPGGGGPDSFMAGQMAAAYEPGTPVRSVAVLPFENFSEDGQPDYFSAGMHEAVVLQLSQISALRVVSRTSVMQYADATKPLPRIARELGVEAIVEGSVLRADDRVRITVQLIHGPSDTHIWSQSYERDFNDIIALQGEVAKAIAAEIQAELTPEEETMLASGPPVDPEAQDAYMRGRFEQAKDTPEGFEGAIGHYREAVQMDSSFADAYTGLAGAQLLLTMSEPDSAPDAPPVEVHVAVERALALEPGSPEAQAVLAELNRQIVELSDSLREELIIVGIDADSLIGSSDDWAASFTEFGRQAQRVALARGARAHEVESADRQVAIARRLAVIGQSEEAEGMLREAIELDPSRSDAWDALEHLYVIRGDFEEVVELRRERVAAGGGDPEDREALASLARAVADQGSVGYWEWRYRQLEEAERRGDELSQVDFAAAAVAIGRHDEALERLDRAFEGRDRRLATLGNDPVWDPIRGDPRFRDLMRRVRRVPVAPRMPDGN
jgi:TolB-like protein